VLKLLRDYKISEGRMKGLITLMLLMVFSISGVAGTLTFSKGSKSKKEYESSKCIAGTFAVTSLKAKLTIDEVCRYGKKGCPSIKSKNKIYAYCGDETLSECFNNKSWLSMDQILDVSLIKEPGFITYGLNKNSKDANKTCGYWD
jgi:hypothetical protein